jgi:hypothetical protein
MLEVAGLTWMAAWKDCWTDSDGNTEGLPGSGGTEDGIGNGSIGWDGIHKDSLDLDETY